MKWVTLMLELNQVSVKYGDIQVLWEVSLKVHKGEIVALIGANGAGKSTTLKTISGLVSPFKGTVEFQGERIDQLPAHKMASLGIAHVPEGRRLFPEMTVRENLEMGALSPKAREHRAETMAEVFDLFPRLKERMNQAAGTLSGGEQQMLAVGRGLMSRPALLMLDEPSLGLAPLLVQEIFHLVLRINETGMTVLLVEQNVRHSLETANRAYVLDNGRIALEGPGRDLLDNDHVRAAYLGL